MSEIDERPARIVIAEDQALINYMLTHLLNEQKNIDVVAQTFNGAEALEATRSLHPDIVLMDIRMPFMDGLEATRAIKDEINDVNVVILTTFDSPRHRYFARDFGASEFLLKDISHDDLLHTLDDVYHAPFGSPSRTLTDKTVPHDKNSDSYEFAELTARERDVIIQVAEGYTNEQIANTLHISIETVKTHIRHILPKIHASNRMQIISFAYENALLYKYNPYEPAATYYDERGTVAR
ncbi:response regulator transcription factor [Alloscardovia theropitheci]|uniref:Response regulator transcription factor n=1 Tax=Alloscardovia theropitheci TaxID=2496842 RepID=A0A4R0QQE8_9BIFI|nr:response regulator transcription factor [Alloscardovia theropitheci]TCD53538.1 response regulator transcription factor [Alloscardovia theropitheci]